jgi:16S rRNA A1518/A1519 N6-dimethyltransferase RsmA/KsgA/DIM1 with predicted DNA glycosylase/AP lyase activity
MKRKTLLNNLKKDYREEIIRSSLKEAGVRADVRAEALPLETSAQVFRQLQSNQEQT